MFRTRNVCFRPSWTALVLASCAVTSGPVALACTIPVFRYALERWESDRFIVLVYHDGQLAGEQASAVRELEQRSSLAGGPLNLRVVRYDVAAPPPPTILSVQPPPADVPLPWVQILSSPRATPTAVHWQGPLADAINLPGFYESPARAEIARRILQGSSAVWLLVAPPEQLQPLSEQLQATLDRVALQQTLPAGIGLPGSELYASIPLKIGYSVLAVSHTDPLEQPFLKQLGVSAKEWRTENAYVIPVFGRCRALEVIPQADVDELLIEEIATFLCGACSCRVKEANPGFDLLTALNWNESLFKESFPQTEHSEAQLPASVGLGGVSEDPEYVKIPIGFPPADSASSNLAPQPMEPLLSAAERAVPSQTGESNREVSRTSYRRTPFILGACGGLLAFTVVGGVLARILRRRT